MNKTIQYAINTETGQVWSRVWSEVAVPVLDWDGMTEENGYDMQYSLEKMAALSIPASTWRCLKWTRKVPTWIKNVHRRFWGMKELKESEAII